jgi:nitrite reductase (NADH) small subunit
MRSAQIWQGGDMAFQEACGTADLPPGGTKIVEIGRLSIGLYNVDDRIYAVRNLCPHHGAELCRGEFGGTMLPSEVGEYQFGMADRVIQCPRHAWQFDIETGRALHDPKRRCRVYVTKVENGRVLVDV